ncbi:MAG: hypothetical protein JJT89_13420 [Nitriliruptoraceae bacterium]|nr:hypothetical protein [Nitriliruptoraceae bacterium]
MPGRSRGPGGPGRPPEDGHLDGVGGPDEGALVRFAELTRVPGRPQADVLAGALRSEGFTVRVAGDDGGGTIPPLGRLTGGIRIEVAVPELDDARALLTELEQGPVVWELGDDPTVVEDHTARPGVGWLVMAIVIAVVLAAVFSG